MTKIHFTGIDHSRKHRVHMWINTENLEPLYGIQANVAYGVWAHVTRVVAGERTPVLFPTKAEAQAQIKDWASS